MSVASFVERERVEVPFEVLGLDHRIKNGDATLNWRGDPDMELCYNPHFKRFEVIGLSETREPYVAAASATAGPHLIVDLALGDWRHGPALLDRIYKDIDAATQRREDAIADKKAEVADKLAFQIRRVFGTGRKVF